MKLKNQLASLLSDVQEYLNFGGVKQVNERLNFVKWVIFQNYDLEKEYTTDEVNNLYEEYKKL